MKNSLVEEIISLFEGDKLTVSKIKELKEKYDPNDVDVVSACITDDIDSLTEYIQKGYNLYICNDKVLRYTVSNGYIEVSKMLLKNGIEP